MLNRAGNGLAIFDNFVPDRSLPKYTKEGKFAGNPPNIIVENDAVDFVIRGTVVNARKKVFGWFARLWAFIVELFSGPNEARVVDFFHRIKESAQDIQLLEARARGYQISIIRAQRAGQTALLEKLQDGFGAYVAETHMLSLGIERFVTEESVVKFCKKSTKGIRLDYVKNFTRAIPNNLVTLKNKADELGIFDNYAVMHYDPNKKSWAETKEEIAAKKDPILFGLLKGRTDLYILGDWTDEYCDLTLDKMAEVLGTDPREFIDRDWVTHEAVPDQEESAAVP